MDTDNSITQEIPEKPRITARKVFPLVMLTVLLGFFILFALVIQETVGFKNFFILASNFLHPKIESVANDGGRINILILGKAGGTHDGKDLTDTIILASIPLDEPGVSLISLPRDLWIPEIRAKVNSAYYWGNQKGEGGMDYSKSIVEKVTGATIHYGVVIDFSAFREIVDAIGGIDVNVERGFTDRLYPIEGKENDLCDGDKTYACRYQIVTFNSGIQKMDGETTLKFVRSRMAEGEEGTDQAREARQQKVIGAIKSKLLSPAVYLNPSRLLGVYKITNNSVETDIGLEEGAIITRKFLEVGNLINQYLVPGGLLLNPPISKTYDSQYVLIPKVGNGVWTEIKSWALEGPLSPGK